jgi:hypothetical protein
MSAGGSAGRAGLRVRRIAGGRRGRADGRPESPDDSSSTRKERDRGLLRDRRFLAESVLAILVTIVVFVQTERIAQQSAQQNEQILARSEVAENVRFVRETVIGDSLTMPFANLDLQYTSLQGLHFGCSDDEWVRARAWHDKRADERYKGNLCTANFGLSNEVFSPGWFLELE